MAKSIPKISAAEFKSKCLSIMKQVQKTGKPVIVTKRGVPLIKITPYDESGAELQKNLYGFMKNTFSIQGDIMSPVTENWEADK